MSILKASMVIRRMSRQLPKGVAFLVVGDRSIFPLNDEEGNVAEWVMYIQKRGTGERPALNQVAGMGAGVHDLGNDWRLGKVVVSPSELNNAHRLIWLIQQCVDDLEKEVVA